jgi:hypothetical protein
MQHVSNFRQSVPNGPHQIHAPYGNLDGPHFRLPQSGRRFGALRGGYTKLAALRQGVATNVQLRANMTVTANMAILRDPLQDSNASIGINQICFVNRNIEYEKVYPNRHRILSLSAMNYLLYTHRGAPHVATAELILHQWNFAGIAVVVKPILENDRSVNQDLMSSIAVGHRARCVNYWGIDRNGFKSGIYLWLVLCKRNVKKNDSSYGPSPSNFFMQHKPSYAWKVREEQLDFSRVLGGEKAILDSDITASAYHAALTRRTAQQGPTQFGQWATSHDDVGGKRPKKSNDEATAAQSYWQFVPFVTLTPSPPPYDKWIRPFPSSPADEGCADGGWVGACIRVGISTFVHHSDRWANHVPYLHKFTHPKIENAWLDEIPRVPALDVLIL